MSKVTVGHDIESEVGFNELGHSRSKEIESEANRSESVK